MMVYVSTVRGKAQIVSLKIVLRNKSNLYREIVKWLILIVIVMACMTGYWFQWFWLMLTISSDKTFQIKIYRKVFKTDYRIGKENLPHAPPPCPTPHHLKLEKLLQSKHCPFMYVLC